MHLFGIRVFEQQEEIARQVKRKASSQLRAVAAVMLTLAAGVPSGCPAAGGVTGAGANAPEKQASTLPAAPAPVPTEPLICVRVERDFSSPRPFSGQSDQHVSCRPTIAKASFANSVRLNDLVKDGKIYLSLSDAIALALENNYDIAIARYDLDIADTDILRTRDRSGAAGCAVRPDHRHPGRFGLDLDHRRRPGRNAGRLGRRGFRRQRIDADHRRRRSCARRLWSPRSPAPFSSIATIARQPASSPAAPAPPTPTTSPTTRASSPARPSSSPSTTPYATTPTRVTSLQPAVELELQGQVTQHLLQGAGIWVNKRFIYQALNDRRITDSSFRQQILYTVNQVETIYWGLVQAYEDVQAKERALEQSTKLAGDNRKQLEIGTMAPLDVVNADSTVATDKQALISSQST